MKSKRLSLALNRRNPPKITSGLLLRGKEGDVGKSRAWKGLSSNSNRLSYEKVDSGKI